MRRRTGARRRSDRHVDLRRLRECADTPPVTILQLATLIQQHLRIPGPLRAQFLPYEALPGRYQDVRTRIPDVAKAERLLGFSADMPLTTGVARTIEWHRERAAEREVVSA